MDVCKVRERNVQMKSKRRKCTNEKWEKEMYICKVREGNVRKWKVRERNVRMKSKRRKCTYEK